MKRKAALLRIFPVVSLLFFVLCGSGDTELTGGTDAAQYVSGRIDPLTHPLFVRLDTLGIPCDRPQYLRKEAAIALRDMYCAFSIAHPGMRLVVRSSARTFADQAAIWTRKWNELCEKNPGINDRERASDILRYSSMPGTSRHHWGTDFDLNELVNGYYDKGEGLILYKWLCENAGRYGFVQPYTAGRAAGYREERWHWSYRPLSSRLVKRWNELFEKDPGRLFGKKEFPGSHLAVELAPVYVNAINRDCFD